MEINGTLLVQIAHFICVYTIVDHILLRPVLARIQSDRRKQQALEGDIADLQRRIDERKRYNEQDWSILQKRLRAECPMQQIGCHTQVFCEGGDSESRGIPMVSDDITVAAQEVAPAVVASILRENRDIS